MMVHTLFLPIFTAAKDEKYFTSFQKSNMGWPQQPDRYQISVKNWIFWYPFNKKGSILVILVPVMIQPSGPEAVECWGSRDYWGCRGYKAWKITNEDFKVIQVVEFSFILMFWEQLFLGRIMKYQNEFLAPFLSEAVEASVFYFC